MLGLIIGCRIVRKPTLSRWMDVHTPYLKPTNISNGEYIGIISVVTFFLAPI